jgi:hypothetical protein
MSSPTQRSLAYLRKDGFTVCVVERFIPARGGMKFPRRIDAFNFGDLLACRLGQIVLVQTTTKSNMAARRAKILALPDFPKWKEAGGLVLLHGWRKAGPRGGRKTWQVTEEFL